MVFGIVVAGGKSVRMGANVDKAFLSLGGHPVLFYALRAFEECSDIDGVVLVVRKDRLDAARGMVQVFGCSKVTDIVAGGASRQISVMNGLQMLNDDVKVVAVHDGARPCVTTDLISATIRAAKKYGSGVAAVKITDTVKEAPKGSKATRTVDRDKLWAVQTPQTFKKDLLIQGYEAATKKELTVTDESSAVALVAPEIHLVKSSWSNIKITSPEELEIAAALLKL